MGKKRNVDFTLSMVLILFVGIFTPSFAEDLVSKSINTKDQFREGRVVSSEIEIGYANGGPATSRYNIASASPYPQGTYIEIEASLSVESGYYEISFLYQGKPSFVLKARPNKPAKGKGKVEVTSDGKHMEYQITAKSATNVRYAFNFNSMGSPDETKVSSTPDPAKPAATMDQPGVSKKEASKLGFVSAVSVPSTTKTMITIRGDINEIIKPKTDYSFWILTLAVPVEIQGLDAKAMTIPGSKGSIAALGWKHSVAEKPDSFYVDLTVGSSKRARSDGMPVPQAYLHILFEVPNDEAPAKFDWKDKARNIVAKYALGG